jgi:hypothetical protein
MKVCRSSGLLQVLMTTLRQHGHGSFAEFGIIFVLARADFCQFFFLISPFGPAAWFYQRINHFYNSNWIEWSIHLK